MKFNDNPYYIYTYVIKIARKFFCFFVPCLSYSVGVQCKCYLSCEVEIVLIFNAVASYMLYLIVS